MNCLRLVVGQFKVWDVALASRSQKGVLQSSEYVVFVFHDLSSKLLKLLLLIPDLHTTVMSVAASNSWHEANDLNAFVQLV